MKPSNSKRSLISNYAYLLRRLAADKNIVGICALMVLTGLAVPLFNVLFLKDYLFQTMFDYRFGKELRIFALRDILIEKFNRHKEDRYQLNTQAERRKTLAQAVEALIILVCEAAICYFLLTAFLQGTLAVDNFVLYTGLAASFHAISRGLVEDLMILFVLNVSIEDYRGLVEESVIQISAFSHGMIRLVEFRRAVHSLFFYFGRFPELCIFIKPDCVFTVLAFLRSIKSYDHHYSNWNNLDISCHHTIVLIHLEYIRVLHTFSERFHITHANQLQW